LVLGPVGLDSSRLATVASARSCVLPALAHQTRPKPGQWPLSPRPKSEDFLRIGPKLQFRASFGQFRTPPLNLRPISAGPATAHGDPIATGNPASGVHLSSRARTSPFRKTPTKPHSEQARVAPVPSPNCQGCDANPPPLREACADPPGPTPDLSPGLFHPLRGSVLWFGVGRGDFGGLIWKDGTTYVPAKFIFRTLK
jgi:hypothetical protein